MQHYVPVVSRSGKPLMPTSHRKADRLIAKGRAVRRFDRGLFYIQLTDRADGYTQPIALGIDPGSRREALTVKSAAHTYLNVQADAVTWVKQHVETRREMRRSRRHRKTPYRKCRSNRHQGQVRLPPSSERVGKFVPTFVRSTVPARARWGWKLRIVTWLSRYYPISAFVVEDIQAVTKAGRKRWNTSFSPLEMGKQWFYAELGKLGQVALLKGHETAQERKRLGLRKANHKLSDGWDAHCVDSFVLANVWVGGDVVGNCGVLYLVPLRFHRRQLHRLQAEKGGLRKPYGGTLSLGLKRGSWVKHRKWGVCYVGGHLKGRLSLHDLHSGKRLTQQAKPEDCVRLTRSSWRIRKGVSASSPT